jgi:hypothetical protein
MLISKSSSLPVSRPLATIKNVYSWVTPDLCSFTKSKWTRTWLAMLLSSQLLLQIPKAMSCCHSVSFSVLALLNFADVRSLWPAFDEWVSPAKLSQHSLSCHKRQRSLLWTPYERSELSCNPCFFLLGSNGPYLEALLFLSLRHPFFLSFVNLLTRTRSLGLDLSSFHLSSQGSFFAGQQFSITG